MRNMDLLIVPVAEQIDESENEAWFTLSDMQYACGQIPLDRKVTAQCGFHIIGGEETGTYRFITGFYGLNTMSIEFQRIIETLLEEQMYFYRR